MFKNASFFMCFVHELDERMCLCVCVCYFWLLLVEFCCCCFLILVVGNDFKYFNMVMFLNMDNISSFWAVSSDEPSKSKCRTNYKLFHTFQFMSQIMHFRLFNWEFKCSVSKSTAFQFRKNDFTMNPNSDMNFIWYTF